MEFCPHCRRYRYSEHVTNREKCESFTQEVEDEYLKQLEKEEEERQREEEETEREILKFREHYPLVWEYIQKKFNECEYQLYTLARNHSI